MWALRLVEKDTPIAVGLVFPAGFDLGSGSRAKVPGQDATCGSSWTKIRDRGLNSRTLLDGSSLSNLGRFIDHASALEDLVGGFNFRGSGSYISRRNYRDRDLGGRSILLAGFNLRGGGSFPSRAKFRDRNLGGWRIFLNGNSLSDRDPSSNLGGSFNHASTLENVVDELASLLTLKDSWIVSSSLYITV